MDRARPPVAASLLAPADADQLRAAAFTYPEIGQTADVLPAGYRITNVTRGLPPGTDFEQTAQALLTWQVHSRAGLAVAASDQRVTTGGVVRLRLGIGRLALTAPCRVVYVINHPHRRGFAYGTLPGHPECGEESFVLDRSGDAMTFTITAFSRPASTLAKLAGPFGRLLQDIATRRYLHAIAP